jgi:sigma-B regulation protein RsbU (phosphoserine phosphatase)
MSLDASLLVVDDSEANRDMLSRRLRGKGYAVTAADGGKAALDLIASNRYDLVLLDILMPDVNGLEVLRILRQTRSASDLPVIIATAKDESADIVEGLKAGANDYVTKPLDFPVVLARVQTQISLKRAVDQIKRLEEDLQERNAKLAAANERMQRDLVAAARIQEALLPASLPNSPRASFAWFLEPCEELAGDTLNVFSLDEDHVAMYVLDVVGHGVAAALLSVALNRVLSPGPDSFLLRPPGTSAGPRFRQPAEVAQELDRRFPFDAVTEQFFTLVYGILDLRSREWRYVSAGHPSPVMLARDSAGPRVLPFIPALPIGLGEERYEEQIVALQPGDRLYLYSDGVPEALDGENKPFQIQRLLNVLAENRSASLAQSVSALENAVRAWSGGTHLHDDASLAALEIPQ